MTMNWQIARWAMAPMLLLVAGLSGCYWPIHEETPAYGPAYGGYPYDYYYYPSVDVYYQLRSGDYFYRRDHNGRWLHARTLPPNFRLERRDRIDLRMDSNRPWERHDEHIGRYRPRPDYKPDPRLDRGERKHNQVVYERYRQGQDNSPQRNQPYQRGGQNDQQRNDRLRRDQRAGPHSRRHN